MSIIMEPMKKLSVNGGGTRKQREFNKKQQQTKELSVIVDKQVVTKSDNNYIVAVTGMQSSPEYRVAVALTDNTCIVHSINDQEINSPVTLIDNSSPIVGIKFSPTSRNILYTARNDGTVAVCDLRAKGKTVAEFKDNSEDGKPKPLASFDVNSNEHLMAAGTEHTGGDAFILFWDVRYNNSSKPGGKNSLLGGYWESHVDDITTLAFHPTKSDVLASGSTDGLINVFDLTQTSEDAALEHSLNTESSVERLDWINDQKLWCTTHMHSLQFWDCEDATPYAQFDRNTLSPIMNSDSDNCYFVRTHLQQSTGYPFVLAGSSSVKGETLKCLSLVNDQLEVCYDAVGNKQCVRDSWIHEKSGCLITVGEGGLINVWRQSEATKQIASEKSSMKIGSNKSRDRHCKKPY